MIYLYVLTPDGELTPAVAAELQEAHPQRFRRKARVLGTQKVEDGLPESDEQSVRETGVRVCDDHGLDFNPALDDVKYRVHRVEGVDYGVFEIDLARFASASVYAAAAVFFAVGFALEVTTVSVWLLAFGFGAFLVYLWLRGPVQAKREGWLFAVGPTILVSWVAGFVARGLIF